MPRRNGAGIDLLADPTRRRIVALLALGRSQPSVLARELGLSNPAVSRQLRLLERAGLIDFRRHFLDGRRRVYYIERRRLGQIAAWLAGTEVGREFPYSDRLLLNTDLHEQPDSDVTSAWAERFRNRPADRFER